MTAGWVGRVKAAENRGDLLIAYDLAMQGLARHPDSVDLSYLATRVLARSGATDSAAACYVRFGLARQTGVDVAALGARLAKDRALASPRRQRGELLRAAASAYRRIYARTREHYPAINAATLYLLAGDEPRALALARQALKATACAPARTALDRYYRAATRAEAALIFRDTASARAALQDAARHLGASFSASATTRRQLRLVCRARKISDDVLDLIKPPSVLHYAGEDAARFGDRWSDRHLAQRIDTYLGRHGGGFAYGSLSAGGEILFAEACLQIGAELNVVLPFRQDEFVDTFVRPAGAAWVRRFHGCLGRARSVSYATTDAYQGDDDLLAYANRLAMGMALLRAQHLDAAARQVTVAVGAGALADRRHDRNLATWRKHGHGVDVLRAPASPGHRLAWRRHSGPKRIPPRYARAILFGDVKGYSRVADHLVPLFQQHVMGTIARAFGQFGDHVLYRNSWGDAIYVVIDDPVIGARCAVEIQAAMRKANFARFGFAVRPELRLGVHFGPLYDGYDPVCEERTFFGAHATIAARLEPVTPPGQVYVTEAMAAALAMATGHPFRCGYVGTMPAAKGFGLMRMYSLT